MTLLAPPAPPAPPSTSWTDVTHRLGIRVLPHSRFVPVDAWLHDPRSPGRVLRLVARGTRVRLTAYDRGDLTTLLLRAECDCEEHRTAGASGRPALAPGSLPLAEAVYDGAARAGWSGVRAGLLRRDEVAPILVELWETLARDGASTARSA